MICGNGVAHGSCTSNQKPRTHNLIQNSIYRLFRYFIPGAFISNSPKLIDYLELKNKTDINNLSKTFGDLYINFPKSEISLILDISITGSTDDGNSEIVDNQYAANQNELRKLKEYAQYEISNKNFLAVSFDYLGIPGNGASILIESIITEIMLTNNHLPRSVLTNIIRQHFSVAFQKNISSIIINMLHNCNPLEPQANNVIVIRDPFF